MIDIKPVRIGLVLCVLTILFGYSIGALFGAKNSDMKAYYKEQAYVVNAATFPEEKTQKLHYEKSKAYIKRAHLHAAAIGSAGLATILLLSLVNIEERKKKIASLLTGVGASGYGVLVWTLMSFATPILGKHGAHEAIAWLAIPTGLSLMLGTALTAYYVATCKK